MSSSIYARLMTTSHVFWTARETPRYDKPKHSVRTSSTDNNRAEHASRSQPFDNIFLCRHQYNSGTRCRLEALNLTLVFKMMPNTAKKISGAVMVQVFRRYNNDVYYPSNDDVTTIIQPHHFGSAQGRYRPTPPQKKTVCCSRVVPKQNDEQFQNKIGICPFARNDEMHTLYLATHNYRPDNVGKIRLHLSYMFCHQRGLSR